MARSDTRGQEPLPKVATALASSGPEGDRNPKNRFSAGLADCLCSGGQVPMLITLGDRTGTGFDGT